MVNAGYRLKCRIEGVGLADLDFFSKSDPICLVEEFVGNAWQVRDQTEKIDNELNPVFQRQPEFAYTSGAQKMKFTMWDHDGGSAFELIGLVECTVDDLLPMADTAEAWEQPLIHPEKPNSKRGTIKVFIERC